MSDTSFTNDDTGANVRAQTQVDSETAANLIRDKVARIYAGEPSAAEEIVEAEAAVVRSKHQQFMHELNNSGKDLATIQTEWHNYYTGLPSDQKHQVWQEFYASGSITSQPVQQAIYPVVQPQVMADAATAANPATHNILPPVQPGTGQMYTGTADFDPQLLAEHKNLSAWAKRQKAARTTPKKRVTRDTRSAREVQSAIRDTVTAGGKLKLKHHLQSLAFGLGMGTLVVLIFLFSFFNEVVIAPFIQPSRVAAATPIIVDSSTVAPSANPEVIIPKINVQIPVKYGANSINEEDIQTDLEDGVVHYPTTVNPGQQGNAAYFGHSSNNIFNKGKYKFAFVLLHTLVPGDTFYLTHNKIVYVYKVIDRKVVDPSEIGVLGPVAGQPATATLITCDPPGTSLKRLVVVGQQISPDPSGNAAAPVATPASAVKNTATTLPGNGPTLLSRVLSQSFGKTILIVFLILAVAFVIRWTSKVNRNG
ncbi:sortase [Candidatus Saccharibacteria bacterium]|nr:sortase [Candidatus Saccharibacteria bacterium]